MTPEIFAVGDVSRQLSVHGATIFSPNGKEMYWAVMKNPELIKIYLMKKICEEWTSHRL
jgi:hypothetical protein